MATTVAINGFGRIGRRMLRAALQNKDVQIVAVNDLSPIQTAAHLFEYDSIHGKADFGEIRVEENALLIGPHRIKMTAERDPSKLPWKELGIEIVAECTGIFTEKAKASSHIQAGAKKVLVSAPSKDADATICMGINHENFDVRSHDVISAASCTTNCLAPIAKILDEEFGIVRGLMVTIHSYTNDQNVLDLSHSDLRRARAAALSQIPTTTGAAKSIGQVLPRLKGKLDGYAVRVPTPNVSMVDLTVELSKSTSTDEINRKFMENSSGKLKGILGYSNKPLVSTDYNGNRHSCTVDSLLTQVIGGNFTKVIGWYDNETGFSYRMLDLAAYVGKQLKNL